MLEEGAHNGGLLLNAEISGVGKNGGADSNLLNANPGMQFPSEFSSNEKPIADLQTESFNIESKIDNKEPTELADTVNQKPKDAASTQTQPERVLDQTQSSEITVIANLTSSSISKDNNGAISAFRTALFEIIKIPRPENIDSPITVQKKLFMRIFNFGGAEQVLGYSQLVARYVSLWSVFERIDTQRFAMQALLGIHLLSKGQLKASSQILQEIEFQTSSAVALSYVMKGVGLFVRSLVFFSFLAGYTLIIFHRSVFGENAIIKSDDFSTISHVIVAIISGMMGSVVSILLRLGEFETTKGRSRMFLMLTGATLPVVGGMFGAFVAALLSANVINLTGSGSTGLNSWLFLVIGFLSGFSERFSRGFIKIAEDRLGGGPADQKASISAQAIVSAPQVGAAPVTG